MTRYLHRMSSVSHPVLGLCTGFLVGGGLSLGIWNVIHMARWISDESFADLLARFLASGCILGSGIGAAAGLLLGAPNISRHRRLQLLRLIMVAVPTACALVLGKPYLYHARNDFDHVSYFLGFYRP